MERLTKRNENGVAVLNIKCPEGCEHSTCSMEEGYQCQHQCEGDIIEKLTQYEELEEHGSLLTLPCKVGDIVYHEDPYVSIHTGIQSYKITNIMISQNKKGEWTKKYRAMLLINGKIVDSQLNFSFDDIGKTVFISKKEVENCNK